MRIASGTAVAYVCVVRDAAGTVVQASSQEDPTLYVHGITPIFAPLAEALHGMEVGAQRIVELDVEGQVLSFELAVVQVREATETEAASGTVTRFPMDVMGFRDFPGALPRHARLCMVPPFPWGQWLYGQVYDALCADLSGDIVECGVGLGGTTLFLADHTGRTVHAFDTFEGLPPPDAVLDNPYWLEGLYDGATPLLDRLVAHTGDRDVRPVVGRFEATMDQLPHAICFAHLDSDLYSSVRTSLEAVWERLVPGGVVAIDDFFHPARGPARACADVFNALDMLPVYNVVFPYSVFVVKAEQGSRADRVVDGNVYAFDWLRRDTLFRQVVHQAVTSAPPGSRLQRNAARLWSVVGSDVARPSDYYEYMASLADFWQGIAAGFTEVAPI